MRASITISPSRVFAFLAAVIVFLLTASLALQYARHFLGYDYGLGLIDRFYVDTELNVPTWYASTTLFISALILGAIAMLKLEERGPFARHWMVLAVIFVLLSLDEAASFHELLIAPLHRRWNTTGAFHPAWVIPAIPAVAVFALAYLRFLMNLPRKTASLVALAGFVFVAGALGMEMAGAQFTVKGEWDYVLAVHVEEGLEKAGIAVFIYALLDYTRTEYGELRIRIGVAEPDADSAPATKVIAETGSASVPSKS